ncbi:serine hydrolase domain-containing protein [Phenylobacterium sp.]|uniref:serine hydrolase domain-containing protein n=1 Tax=Phenylobacterium sp. TaxID=1871053 RepID=UPI00289C3CD3|nr:serine hydrolase domain-containing protein [Phenylobacterium sp.]
MTPPPLDDLADRVSRARAAAECPGLTFGVILHGRMTSAAAGVVNIETGVEARPDSLFQVGSITKAMTATLIMQAAEARLLDLDAPVETYLGRPIGKGPYSGPFSCRQLLAHLSGLDGDLFADTGRDDEALARYVAQCEGLEVMSPPGLHYNYSNAGYVVLGRVLEIVHDRSFDHVLREQLLAPLGLRRSTTFAEDAVFARTAVGHAPDVNGRPALVSQVTLPRALGPAGLSLYSTVEDLLSFAKAHLAGAPTIPSSIIAAMKTPHARLIDGTAWGLGWKLIDRGAVSFVGHDGGTIGQSAFLWTAPEYGLAVALCANGGDASAAWEALAHPVFRDICGQIPQAELPAPSDGPIDLAPFVGRYENVGVDAHVTVDGDRLKVVAHQQAFALPPIVFHMRPLGGGLFRATVGQNDRIVMGFLDFDLDGRPQLFYAGRLHRRRAS